MKIIKILLFISLIVFWCEGLAKAAAIAGCVALCAVNVVTTPEAMELCEKCMQGANSLSCFSDGSTFILQNNSTLNASEIKKGDSLLTLNNEYLEKYSKVIFHKKIVGKFNFVTIYLENGKSIKVTNEHGIVFIENNKQFIKTADKIKKGDILMTNLGNSKVEKIERSMENVKYVIETEDGTVFSNEIFVSTICNEEISEKKNFKELIQKWSKNHQFLFKNLIK